MVLGCFTLSQQGRHRSTIMGAKTSTSGIGIFVACDLSTVTDALFASGLSYHTLGWRLPLGGQLKFRSSFAPSLTAWPCYQKTSSHWLFIPVFLLPSISGHMRRTTNAKSSRDMILAGGLARSQGIWIQSRSWINYLSPAALHITVSNGHLKH